MIGMSTQDKAYKKRLSDAYNAMMQSEAWKDLVEYANGERESSMKRIDSKAAADLVIQEVCEERGMRKGIFKIIQHAEMSKEGI